MTIEQRVDAFLRRHKLSINTYSKDIIREELIGMMSPPFEWKRAACSKPLCTENGFCKTACYADQWNAALADAGNRGGAVVRPTDRVDLSESHCAACDTRQEDHFRIVHPADAPFDLKPPDTI